MGKYQCKDPNGKPTRKQTFAVFCMTGYDLRGIPFTRQQISDAINDLKEKGVTELPTGAVIHIKSNGKKADESIVNSPAESSNSNSDSWALDLIKEAEAAGEKAMQLLIDSRRVAPMVVQQHVNVLDDSSPVKQSWVVQGGPCGFASIRVKCTNGPSRKFISQLKKAGIAGDRNSFCEWAKSDYGGFLKSFTVIGGQSMAYKKAYAYAYEGVLAKEGINTWVESRMD